MGRSEEKSETRLLSSGNSSPLRDLLPMKSLSATRKRHPDPKLSPLSRRSMRTDENDPPLHFNVTSDSLLSPQKTERQSDIANSIHRFELNDEDSDASVKVVARIRPANEHEKNGLGAVTKVSSDTVSVEERRFFFDSVLNTNSDQEDVFRVIGVPLVESALVGYNSTILSYGQSGSGKTYTMFGPPSSMLDDSSAPSDLGLAPRVFQMLFDEIEKQRENSEGKQVDYQCRCSFLEIYNDEIRDLLQPSQRNLNVEDDTKHGLHVVNLSEKYVSSYEDVTQVLVKGLSTRKVNTTSMNTKSSSSHAVFTFIVESWCKENSSTRVSSSKISKIMLVDLAGMRKDLAKEGKLVKKSLSHLGQLVHVLSKRDDVDFQQESLPYEDSNLTHLLKESLGGNARLAVVCNISPGVKNTTETLRTLRFGQRVRRVKNNPLVNEISDDDVDGLSDQIRRLKNELINAKTDSSRSGSFGARNGRTSLNLLRVSLNRSLLLNCMEDSDADADVTEVADVDMNDIRRQLEKLHQSVDDTQFSSAYENFDASEDVSESVEVPDPVASESPKFSTARGSLAVSENFKSSSGSPKFATARRSFAESENHRSSSGSLKFSTARRSFNMSENLRSSSLRESIAVAASLQKGMEIINNRNKNRSSVSFSFDNLAPKTASDAVAPPETCPSCKRTDNDAMEMLRSSLMDAKLKAGNAEEIAKWTEMESNWILLADGLRVDLEASRVRVEDLEAEIRAEKMCSEELDDALRRAIVSHGKMVEHFVDLQEKYDALVGKHRAMLEGVAEIKRAAAKAGSKSGQRFSKAVANELSCARMRKERERELLRKENKILKGQLHDTAEAVHAAGELLVRLRESEETLAVAEENRRKVAEENERIRKQMEKMKRNHKMDMATFKQCLAGTKLPDSALSSLFHKEDEDTNCPARLTSWREEFTPI